jgi:hypothetical protein
MKSSPQTDEGWERFWLVALVTLVLGIAFCYGQFNSPWFATKALGDWIAVPFILATTALGIYSVVLLCRGRILLALIGFITFVLGALCNMPTL